MEEDNCINYTGQILKPVIWGPFSISHLLSLIFVIIGIIVYKLLSNKY